MNKPPDRLHSGGLARNVVNQSFDRSGPNSHGGSLEQDLRQSHVVRTSSGQNKRAEASFENFDANNVLHQQKRKQSYNKGQNLPPRRPTMTSSARSLQPLDGQPKLNPPPTFNPNPVIKPPLMPQDPKMQKMASSVEQQKELLRQLKEQKERTERELAQNQLMMS